MIGLACAGRDGQPGAHLMRIGPLKHLVVLRGEGSPTWNDLTPNGVPHSLELPLPADELEVADMLGLCIDHADDAIVDRFE